MTIELKPGQYLVEVWKDGARIWKHEGNGRCSGVGGKFTKPSVGQAFYEMDIMSRFAEEQAAGEGAG